MPTKEDFSSPQLNAPATRYRVDRVNDNYLYPLLPHGEYLCRTGRGILDTGVVWHDDQLMMDTTVIILAIPGDHVVTESMVEAVRAFAAERLGIEVSSVPGAKR